MKTYQVPYSYTVVGTMLIEASSIEEAVKKAYESPLEGGEYLNDSLEVDASMIYDSEEDES